MANAVLVTQTEFEKFVVPLGFQQIKIEGTVELVYAKIVKLNQYTFSLRIYSSINPDGNSRSVGSDAIRVALFIKTDTIKMVGGDKRVHRVEGWRSNLGERLNNWQELLTKSCPKCNGLTALRKPKAGAKWKAFYGCINYPVCKGSVPA